MPVLKMSGPLRPYIDGQAQLDLHGSTVQEVMDDLLARYPALRPHLLDGNGGLRGYINIFLNDQDIRALNGMGTSLQESDRLVLLPSIAGG